MVLTLYGVNVSPPCRATLMTAKLLNLQLNEKLIDLKNGDHLTPEFLKLNPQHSIPTLTDDNFAIWDSHVISTYLVGKYGKDDSLYPKDLQQRAVVDQRLHFDSGIVFPRLRGLFLPVLMLGMKEFPEERIKDVLDVYGFLEAFLERSTWLAGEKMTLADVCMVAGISSLHIAVPVMAEKFPKLSAWFDRFNKLPFYKEMNIPGLEKLKEIIQKCMA